MSTSEVAKNEPEEQQQPQEDQVEELTEEEKQQQKEIQEKMKMNLDLWSEASRMLFLIQRQSIQINWIHIKGHAGHINNEIVDRLANLLSQTKLKT